MSANLTLVVNAIAVLLIGVSVALTFPAYPEHLASVGMAYLAGLLTAIASRYNMAITSADDATRDDRLKGGD